MAPMTQQQALPGHKARRNTTKRQGGDDRPSAARRRELRVLLVADQEGLCAWCGEPITVEGCELDKVEPAVRKRKGTRRGTYHRDNLVASCRRCNRRRGADQRHRRVNGAPRFLRGDSVVVLAAGDGYEDVVGIVARDASWSWVVVELDDGVLLGVHPAGVRHDRSVA